MVLTEKIEHHLLETNKLFTDETKFKSSIEYLIKNFWSIIAYGYNDKNLSKLKHVRDDLLLKVDKVDKLVSIAIQTQDQKRETSNLINSISLINGLDTELVSVKQETFSLKEKVLRQNELLKAFISEISNVTNLHEQSLNKNPDTSLDQEDKSSRMSKSQTSLGPAEPETSINKATHDYYYYNVNGYIAIDGTLELNEQIEKKPSVNGEAESEPSPSASEEVKERNESLLYKCPKCKTSVDSASISYETYQLHIENCDADNNLICMFCLCWFDKANQDEYLEHIDHHLVQLSRDLNQI